MIETTTDHPFYTSDGEWLSAGELNFGDQIFTPNSGFGLVQNTATVLQMQPMYNLTVADAHTYFVGEGQWLVHNSCIKFDRNTL